MDTILRDIRYAMRGLLRSRGFFAVAVLTLALGVGANTVVFSFLRALILRPLPIARPESVFFVQSSTTFTHSFPNYRDLRDRNRTLSELAGYRLAWMALDMGSGASQAWGYLATGNYFQLLGIQPAAGRFFGPEDDVKPGGSPYAVLSYPYWQRQFDGNPAVVGSTVRINGLPYAIVGVAPRDFHGTEVFFRPNLWVPMTMQPQIEGWSSLDARRTSNTLVVGRLRDGVTREQAEADLNAVATVMASENPNINGRLRVALATPGLWGDTLRGPVSAFVVGTPDAVGRRFRMGPGPNDVREIAGVVDDGKYFSLSEEPRPTVFWPAAASYNSATVIVVRSTLPPAEVASQLRRVVRDLDPRIPLQADGPLTEANALFFLPARAATIALGAFGLLAISLALTGIYGLAAYSVSARVREIGIRLAVGARSYDVLRSILGRTAVILAAGACVGIAAGMAVSQLLTAVVYHASPGDPVVLTAAAGTMALVGLGAAWVPARRALAIDPAQTLREG